MYQNNRTNSIVNRGNLSHIKHCMEKAENREQITVGFLGGSITQGSVASNPKRCYAYRVFMWWKQIFKNTKFKYVNAGIGGTSSLYGVARVEKDLLFYEPDIVFIDFSVNDDASTFFQETFEGLLRKIYMSKKKPAVIVLNNVFYDTGKSAQDLHNQIAQYYEIPCISMREGIYAQIIKGAYHREDLTPDNLHPNDLGHKLIAKELTDFLELVYQEHIKEEHIKEEPIYPHAFTKNTYEYAKLFQCTNTNPLLGGFYEDKSPKQGLLDLYKNGWIGKNVGDKITFFVEAKNIAIQYRKSVKHPVPVAQAVIDRHKDNPIILDGNFEEDWGDCLYLESVLHNGKRRMHTVEIEIVETHEDDVNEFYIVSVIVA